MADTILLLEDRHQQQYGSTSTGQEHYSSFINQSAQSEASPFYKQNREILQEKDTDARNEGFTIVEFPQSDPLGAILERTKHILLPYEIFLTIIGWRKFELPHWIIRRSSLRRMCELQWIWPTILIILLLVSCVTQILLCFGRDIIQLDALNSTNASTYDKSCIDHLVSSYIILDMLLLFAYIYSLYIFRIKQPEDLSSLALKVFCAIEEGLSKKLARSIRIILLVGVVSILYSQGINVLRLFAHHLQHDVELGFINLSLAGKNTLLAISLFGFVVFDVAYTAVVINYAMQCQLIVYFLKGICTQILIKPANWNIEDAIKAINDSHVSLKKINGHLSRATGTMMFIFLYSSVLSLYGIQVLQIDHEEVALLATTGFLSAIQWIIWLFIPLIQAARVTYSGNQIKEIALEIRARPFQYQDTSQLDLDSLVIYCSNVELKAKLISVPISPSLVVGGAYILGFAFFLILQFDEYSWATWL